MMGVQLILCERFLARSHVTKTLRISYMNLILEPKVQVEHASRTPIPDPHRD